MKHRPNIDDLFKRGLEGAGPVYKDEYWNELEPMLSNSKIEGFVLREYVLIGLVVLAQVFLFYGISFENSSKKSEKTASVQQEPIEQEYNRSATPFVSKNEELNTADHAIDGFEKVKTNRSFTPLQTTITIDKIPDQVTEILISNIVEEQDRSLAVENTIVEEHSKMQIIELQGISPQLNEKISPSKIQNIGPHRSPFTFFLEPFIAYQLYNRSFDQQDLKKVKEREHPGNNVISGMHFRMSKGSWSFQTGFGVNRLNEKVSYTGHSEAFSYDSTLRVVNWNYGLSPSGTQMVLVDWETDTSSQILQENICEECITNFTYFSIPIQIQYALSIGKLQYFGGVGLNTQFLIGSKGVYVMQDEPIQIKGRDKGLRPLVLTADLSLGFRGRIHGPFGYSLSYHYAQGLNSMTENYDQIPRFQSINLGLSLAL